MKKFELKRALGKIQRTPSWMLLIVLCAGVMIEATMLRNNHLEMNHLREKVLAADEEGNDELIAERLNELKNYARKHTVINIIEKNGVTQLTFGTGPIYLERQYIRKASEALEKAQAEAGDDSNPNGNVFAKAMDVCKPQAIANGWSWNSQAYIDCMTGEIAKYPTSDFIADNTAANLPSTGLFRHDFVSAAWTPSIEGWLLIICVLLMAILIIKFGAWAVIKIALLLIKK